MPFSEIDILPDPPQRDGDPDTFADLADTFVVALQTFTEQINVFKTELEAAAALINAAPAYADAMLLALADGNTPAADKLPYLTGSTSSAVTDFTSVARTLLAQATQGAMRETGLGMSANGSSLVSAADYSAMRTLLGLVIGTNVQAYDAELAALAGLTSAADKVPYFTGSGAADVMTVTAAARTVLDDTTTAAMLATLGGLALTAGVSVLASSVAAAGGYIKFGLNGAALLTLQWKDVSAASGAGATNATYPTAFDSWSRAWVNGNAGDSGASSVSVDAGTASTTGCTLSNEGSTVTAQLFAIGV